DVTLVVHADPPMEHKAYLHRSGRTARAGADGTVVTLMTDEQVRHVGQLTRRAGIAPTTTRLRPADPLLHRLAPGQRTYHTPRPQESTVDSVAGSDRGRPRRPGRGFDTSSARTAGGSAFTSGARNRRGRRSSAVDGHDRRLKSHSG